MSKYGSVESDVSHMPSSHPLLSPGDSFPDPSPLAGGGDGAQDVLVKGHGGERIPVCTEDPRRLGPPTSLRWAA